METLHVAWKRTPLRRIAKEVLNRLAGALTTDSWDEYAAARGAVTYRAIFEEQGKERFALHLHAEGGDAAALAAYRREMESAILKGGGYIVNEP